MKIHLVILFLTVTSSVAHGQITQVSYYGGNSAGFTAGGATSYDSKDISGPSFQNTLHDDLGVVAVTVSQNTAAPSTASTLDLTSTLSSETDNSQGNGKARGTAQCDISFVLTQPCYFTATGNFYANSSDTCAACGFLLLTYTDNYDPYEQTACFFGEGNFSTYSGFGWGTPSNSAPPPLLLQPGSYYLLALTDCGGPNGTLGTNGKATAQVEVHITGAPSTAPQLTITPSGQRSANITVPSRAGLSYQLQGADDLSQWSNIGSAQAGTGSTISFPISTAPTGSTTRFFYRVVVRFTGGSNGTSSAQKPNHALQRTEAGG